MELNVVLVGPTGKGKSATGNSILGREAFISKAHSSRVTETCELQSTLLEDGRTINVIDTPGFVDTESDFFGEDVEKCFHLARNRIHAFLFVISGEQWISTEDGKDAVGKLKRIFGENIINYMIVVSTHGDAQPYYYNWDFIHLCEDRYVYFYNNTKDEEHKSKQVQDLLSYVKKVGKPFMSQVFEFRLQAESTARDASTRLEQRMVDAHATTMNAIKEQTTQIIDVVEARLRDTTTRLEQQMEASTLKADERIEKYLKEETSELIKQISKSYEEQMTQMLEAVEQRVLDTATRLEQQQAEAHAAQMKVNEIAQEHMTQRFNEEVEQRVLDTATRLEQQLTEAYAAQMRVNELAQCQISQLIQQMTQRINEEAELRVKDVTIMLEEQLAQAEAARVKSDERAQEAQKNSDEHIQKLKEMLERAESRRSEIIPEFGSSSFHVYDPSTYLLQSTIK